MAARTISKSGRKSVRCPKCTALFSEPAKAVFECPICACRLSANGVITVPESPSLRPKDEDSAQIKSVTEPMKMQSSTSIRKGGSIIGNGITRGENSISSEQQRVDSCTQIYKQNQQQFSVENHPVLTNGNSNKQPYVGSAMEAATWQNGVHRPIHSVSKQEDVVRRNEKVESLLLSHVEDAKEDGNLGCTIGRYPPDMSKDTPFTMEDERGEEEDCLINGASSNCRHLQPLFRMPRSEFSFKYYSLRGASHMESDRNIPNRKRTPASRLVSSSAALPDAEKTDVPLRTPLRVRISNSQEESSDQSEYGRHSFGSEVYSDDDDDDGSGSDFDFAAPWAEGSQDIVLPASFGQSEVSCFDSRAVVSTAPHQLELQDNEDAIAEAEISSKVEHIGKAREKKSESRDEELNHGFAQPVSTHEKNHVSLWPSEGVETASELKSPSRDTQILDVSNLASCVSSCVLGDNLVVAEVNEVKKPSDGGGEGEAGQQVTLANMERSAIAQQEAFKPSGAAFRPFGLVVLDHVDGALDSHSISKTGGFQTVDLQKDGGPVHNHQNFMPSGKIKTELFSSVNDQCADDLPSSLMEMEQSNGASSTMDDSIPEDHLVLSYAPIEHAEMEEDLYRLPLEPYGNDSILGGSSRAALWAEEETAVSVLSNATSANASKARLYHERRDYHKPLHGKAYDKSGSRLAGSGINEDLLMSGQEMNLWGPAASQDPPQDMSGQERNLWGPAASQDPPQAMSEHGDWKGRITAGAEQTSHPSLHELKQNPGPYPQYPSNNSLGYALGNLQPYALTNQIYPNQLPNQCLVCAAVLQNHAFSHCGYHAMSPTCMLCSYHQHPHAQPQHIGHCGACLHQSGSIAHNPGHVEYWNSHQASHGSASSCAGSLVETFPSRDQIRRHDFSSTKDRSQTSPPARNARQYPPFPNSGAMPYVTCKGCSRVLQVPSDLRMSNGIIQKLRCGACGKVTKFSINYHDQQRGVVSSIPTPEMDPVGVSKNMPSFVHYSKYTRQPPISVSHWAIDTSPQVSDISSLSASVWSSQGRDSSCIVQQATGDTSLNTSNQHNQMSIISTVGGPGFQDALSQVGVVRVRPRCAAAPMPSATSYGFERLKMNPASMLSAVDEKEEGLDFGAPSISDGDSLDQSESRMRSPENHRLNHEASQILQSGAATGNQQTEQFSSDWNDDHIDQDKKPGSPLLALFNQESTRFRLNIRPRVPLQGSGLTPWSPASDSVLYGNSSNDPLRREQSEVQTHGSPGRHFASKGPKYISGMLRRSLRGFGKGGN